MWVSLKSDVLHWGQVTFSSTQEQRQLAHTTSPHSSSTGLCKTLAHIGQVSSSTLLKSYDGMTSLNSEAGARDWTFLTRDNGHWQFTLPLLASLFVRLPGHDNCLKWSQIYKKWVKLASVYLVLHTPHSPLSTWLCHLNTDILSGQYWCPFCFVFLTTP